MVSKHQNSKSIPWVEKYRPQSLNDMAGFEEEKKKLVEFIKNFEKYEKLLKSLRKEKAKATDDKQKKRTDLKIKSIKSKMTKNRARLMIGPPGVGKTTIAYALANDFGLSVIELNASDVRTKQALNDKLQETVKTTNLLSFTQKITKGKLILIDEVDGLHGHSDRGGISALKDIILTSNYPVLMTCNFKDDQKFKPLYELAKPLIEIQLAKTSDVASVVQKIAKNEGVDLSMEQIKKIAERSNGDYRSAINDLQALSQGTKIVLDEDLDNINMNRDSEQDIYNGLYDIFSATSLLEAKKALDKISSKDADFRNIHRWFSENLYKFVSRKEDIYNAMSTLAFVDNILGYILRTQDYGHLSYFYDILAGGMKYSKTDNKIVKNNIKSPRWFRTRAAPDDEYSKILQTLFRESLNKIMKSIKPNLQIFAKNDIIFQDYLISVFKIAESTEKKNLKILGKALK